MKKDLVYITKPRLSEQILPVPRLFVISRFHCTIILAGLKKIVRYTEDFVTEVRLIKRGFIVLNTV